MKNNKIIFILLFTFAFTQSSVSNYGLSLYSHSHAGILTKKGESSIGIFLTAAHNKEDSDAKTITGVDLSYIMSGGIELQAGISTQSEETGTSDDLETTSLSIRGHIKGSSNFTFGATKYIHNITFDIDDNVDWDNVELHQTAYAIGWYTNNGLIFEFSHIDVEDNYFDYGDYEKITLAQYIRTNSGFCFGIGYSSPIDLIDEGNFSLSIGSLF